MVPSRLFAHLTIMLRDPASTQAQITNMLDDYSTSALSNPNSPERGHDIAYYSAVLKAKILLMVASGFTLPQWKDMLNSQLTTLLPGA